MSFASIDRRGQGKRIPHATRSSKKASVVRNILGHGLRVPFRAHNLREAFHEYSLTFVRGNCGPLGHASPLPGERQLATDRSLPDEGIIPNLTSADRRRSDMKLRKNYRPIHAEDRQVRCGVPTKSNITAVSQKRRTSESVASATLMAVAVLLAGCDG